MDTFWFGLDVFCNFRFLHLKNVRVLIVLYLSSVDKHSFKTCTKLASIKNWGYKLKNYAITSFHSRHIKRLELTRWGPTPTKTSRNSEPFAVMKGTPASPAVALASKVLPVPGGPVNIAPCNNVQMTPYTILTQMFE